MRDYVTDKNPRAIWHATSMLEVPDYVKEAKVTEESVRSLHSSAFADPVNLLFPIHCREAVWKSAAYAMGEPEVSQEILRNIEDAAKRHGIEDDLEAIDELFARSKQASETPAPMEKYALEIDFEGTLGLGEEKFYPINNTLDIVASSELMLKDATDNRLPIDCFYVAARNIVKAAKQNRVYRSEMSESVWQAGEVRWPDFELVDHEINMRKKAGLSEEMIKDYEDLATEAKADFENDCTQDITECIDKYARAWVDCDDLNGIVPDKFTYRNGFQVFYDSGETLEYLDKIASENVVIGDVIVPMLELTGVSDNLVTASFTKEDADIVNRAKEASHGSEASATIEKLSSDSQKNLLRILIAGK